MSAPMPDALRCGWPLSALADDGPCGAPPTEAHVVVVRDSLDLPAHKAILALCERHGLAGRS